MPGRDEQFQRDLRAVEAQARAGAAEDNVLQQLQAHKIAVALQNRTETTIELKNVAVSLFRMVNDEDEFTGVALVLFDQAFNTRYIWKLPAEDADNFSKDFFDTVQGVGIDGSGT